MSKILNTVTNTLFATGMLLLGGTLLTGFTYVTYMAVLLTF